MSAGVCFFAHIQCIDFTVSMNMLTKLVTYYYDSGSSDYSSKIVFDVLALPAARGVKSLPIIVVVVVVVVVLVLNAGLLTSMFSSS